MELILSRYKRDLALRGFSKRTQEHYYRNAKQFLSYHNLPGEQLDSENIKDYLFTQTLNKPWEIESIPQMKKKRTLPSVFSLPEISMLLNACRNMKHKTMLMLTYSAGLRVSEIVTLRISDIKRDMKRILIRQGKGGDYRERRHTYSQAFFCYPFFGIRWWNISAADVSRSQEPENYPGLRSCSIGEYNCQKSAGCFRQGARH